MVCNKWPWTSLDPSNPSSWEQSAEFTRFLFFTPSSYVAIPIISLCFNYPAGELEDVGPELYTLRIIIAFWSHSFILNEQNKCFAQHQQGLLQVFGQQGIGSWKPTTGMHHAIPLGGRWLKPPMT